MDGHCQGCKLMARHKYWNELPSTKHKHRFFKVMANDFHHQMKIPEEFTECFKGKLAGWCTLRGPTGDEWRVHITRTQNKAFFSEGWDKFVEDHGLGFLDLCVFSYCATSFFEVLMFKWTGSEREGAYFTTNSSSLPSSLICSSSLHTQQIKESKQLKEQQNHDDNAPDSWVNKCGKRKTQFDYSSADVDEDGDDPCCGTVQPSALRGTKQCQTIHISRRRPVTKAEREKADNLATRYMLVNTNSGMPTFKIRMRQTHVYHSFVLTIKKQWALEHMCLKHHDVKLRVPGVQGSWIISCWWNQRPQRCQLIAQWPIFVRDNNLEEHDVCVFELVRKGNARKSIRADFNVHIFRVVDEVVPLKVVRKLA